MSDKVQLIKEEIERLYNLYELANDYQRMGACSTILDFIDSLPEHNEDLEEELHSWMRKNCDDNGFFNQLELAHHFAEWQREQMMKDAVEAESRTFSNTHGTFLHIKEGLPTKDGDKAKIIILKPEQQ